MKEQLLELKIRALKELESVAERSDIEKLTQQYLGRKGLLTLLLKKIGRITKRRKTCYG